MTLLLVIILNTFHRLGFRAPAEAVFLVEKYLWARPIRLKKFLRRINPKILWTIAEVKLIYLVNRFIARTPALKDIKEKHFPSRAIRSVKEFKEFFPMLDKDNYIRKFPLEELCQNGALPHAGGFYKSAGTSGNPTLWVEDIKEELAFDKAVSFMSDTLISMSANDYVILNCWSLGTWPTGINFAAGVRSHGKVINIGVNEREALEVLKILGPNYKYLLAGYPPFIHHLVHEAKKIGISIRAYHIDVVSGGEGFVEEWRDSLIEELGGEAVIFSVYGSTDKGLGEGMETTLAYIVRSLLYIAFTMQLDEMRAREIMQTRFKRGELPFSKEKALEFLLDFLKKEENVYRLPMVFQFDPTFYYNENLTRMDPGQEREIYEFLTTMLSPLIAIPRVRYNIHDEGFVMQYEEAMGILKKYDISLPELNRRRDKYIELHLPFLFIFGRADGTISLDGANIFPEDVEQCLRAQPELFQSVNSFQLFVASQYHFGIAIELLPDHAPTEEMKAAFSNTLKNNFCTYSFGYQELLRDKLPSADMVIELHAFESGPFQQRNLKLRYVSH